MSTIYFDDCDTAEELNPKTKRRATWRIPLGVLMLTGLLLLIVTYPTLRQEYAAYRLQSEGAVLTRAKTFVPDGFWDTLASCNGYLPPYQKADLMNVRKFDKETVEYLRLLPRIQTVYYPRQGVPVWVIRDLFASPELNNVVLYRCDDCDVKEVCDLRLQYPQINFSMKGRGYLGLAGNFYRQGWEVKAVALNSPAERAELQPGDLIRRVQGQKIESNHQFMDELSRYNPGDEIEVKILRGQESITTRIMLSYSKSGML